MERNVAKRSNSRRLARRASKASNEPRARSARGRMLGAFLLGYFFLPHSKKK